jgi:membrane-associated phospholipid phosphatase
MHRLTLKILSAYLAVTAVALAVTGTSASLTAVHALAIVALVATGRSRAPWARRVSDVLPLVVAPLLYFEVPLLIAALGTTYHDASVQAWEEVIFRGQPARRMGAALPWWPVSELLHAAYANYYLVIFVPTLLVYYRGARRAYEETLFAMTATFLVSYVLFVLFPVQGPRYLWSPDVVTDGPFRTLTHALLSRGSARGAAFPSLHMAGAVTQAVMAWRYQRRLAPWIALAAALIGVGAVYGGFHYAIDIVAGAALGAAVGALALFHARIRLPGVRPAFAGDAADIS